MKDGKERAIWLWGFPQDVKAPGEMSCKVDLDLLQEQIAWLEGEGDYRQNVTNCDGALEHIEGILNLLYALQQMGDHYGV